MFHVFSFRNRMLPSGYLPLFCGMGSLVTINFCYLLAALNGHVEWCIPYWDSCTSISATGRKMPEAFVFKGMMIPLAFLIIHFWNTAHYWLVQWRDIGKYGQSSMRILGILAALFLIIYTLTLGAHGHLFRQLRHTTVILSFTFTYLAQLLFTWRVLDGIKGGKVDVAKWVPRSQVCLCIVTLAVGISSVVLEAFYAGYGNIEDAFEWNLALLLNLQFILVFFIWNKSRLKTSDV